MHDYKKNIIALTKRIIMRYSRDRSLTCLFLTWCGHPAGMNTASPRYCSNVQGSTPENWFIVTHHHMLEWYKDGTRDDKKFLTALLLKLLLMPLSQIEGLVMNGMYNLR